MLRRPPLPAALHRSRWRLPARLIPIFAVLGVLLTLYLASPYLTLWRIERALAAAPPASLDGLVNIDAVRDELRRRLNKDAASRIGELSDPFIDWLQTTLRGGRNDALADSVTLEWLSGLLAAHAAGSGGLLGAVDHAFFDTPTDFHVRIGREAPVHLHMEPGWLGWRVVAVYY